MLTQREKLIQWIIEQKRKARAMARANLEVEEDMIKSCYAYYAKENPEFAVICIPGRGNDGEVFANDFFNGSEIKNAVFVGPTPKGYAWYPMPNDANNQAEAVNGIPKAIQAIESVQRAIESKYGIPKEHTVLTGFSAGGVMAIQTAAYSEEPYSGVVCISGAILEPKDLPECKHIECPVLLTHNRDDMCFDWHERFIPMKEVLVEKGYSTYTLERHVGGHIDTTDDYEQAAMFMKECCTKIFPELLVNISSITSKFQRIERI